MARLAVYTDAVYGVAAGRLTAHTADHAFLTFAAAVGEHFDECLFVGREQPGAEFLPLAAAQSFVPLPYYPSLSEIGTVLRAAPGTARGLWRALGRVDVVWAFGPHPFASLLILMARLRRKTVVLGVRQDSGEYFPSRAEGPLKLRLAAAAERGFRRAARGRCVTAVGEPLAESYRAAGANALAMIVTTVRASDVAAAVPRRSWETIDLVAVGRLEPEKDPLLLVDALAELERRAAGRFRLVWLGSGALEGEVRSRAVEHGIADRIDLRGHVSSAAVLAALREANVFLLTSRTEGVPQALVEAMACGLPIVAADVGGVRAALDDGAAGVLIGAREPASVADAVMRVVDDEALRERVAVRALALARRQTLEVEAVRVARFVGACSSSAGSSSARNDEPS